MLLHVVLNFCGGRLLAFESLVGVPRFPLSSILYPFFVHNRVFLSSYSSSISLLCLLPDMFFLCLYFSVGPVVFVIPSIGRSYQLFSFFVDMSTLSVLLLITILQVFLVDTSILKFIAVILKLYSSICRSSSLWAIRTASSAQQIILFVSRNLYLFFSAFQVFNDLANYHIKRHRAQRVYLYS